MDPVLQDIWEFPFISLKTMNQFGTVEKWKRIKYIWQSRKGNEVSHWIEIKEMEIADNKWKEQVPSKNRKKWPWGFSPIIICISSAQGQMTLL